MALTAVGPPGSGLRISWKAKDVLAHPASSQRVGQIRLRPPRFSSSRLSAIGNVWMTRPSTKRERISLRSLRRARRATSVARGETQSMRQHNATTRHYVRLIGNYRNPSCDPPPKMHRATALIAQRLHVATQKWTWSCDAVEVVALPTRAVINGHARKARSRLDLRWIRIRNDDGAAPGG